MRIVCKTQGTSEWHQARLGICRGSEAKAFTAKLSRKSKNGNAGDWAGDHWDFVRDLAWERINGVPTGHHVTKPMEVGAMYEGEARVEFWMRHGKEVEQTGFVLHPTLDYLGASVDGYVVEDGLWIPVELKVPQEGTHKKYLEDDIVPVEYVPQLDTEMLCFDHAPYGYFASYCPPDICPEMPDEFRLFKKKLIASKDRWDAIEDAATVTMEQVVERMEKLRLMYPAKGSPRSKTAAELKMSHEALSAAEMGDDYSSEAYAWLDGPGDAA